MPVRDVLSEGAQEPKGLDGQPTSNKPRPRLKQIAQTAYEEAVEMRAFNAGLGLGDIPLRQNTPAEVATAKSELSIAERIVERALGAAERATESARAADRESMTAQLEHLRGEIKEAKQGTGDPVEALLHFEEFRERVKASLGVPQGTVVQASDLPAMIQLENSKLEREERQRQHEERMKVEERRYEETKTERQRQWDKEDRRWEQEFTLKKMEFEHKSGTQDHALDQLGALINSVSEGVVHEEGEVVSGPATQPLDQRAEHRMTSFKCTQADCQGIIQIPATAKQGESVTCPQCQTVYDL